MQDMCWASHLAVADLVADYIADSVQRCIMQYACNVQRGTLHAGRDIRAPEADDNGIRIVEGEPVRAWHSRRGVVRLQMTTAQPSKHAAG